MSIERMRRLLELTRERDSELYGWMAGAWTAILDRDDPRVALGFDGARAIRHRDAALLELAEELAPGRARYAAAGTLADHIDRALDGADDTIGRRIRDLKAYGRLPTTQRHLATILADAQQEKDLRSVR